MQDTTIYYQNGTLWLAIAIVTAGLAESKGRSRWSWFVLALLLGPLATAMVVIWAKPAARKPGKERNSAEGSDSGAS